MDKEQKINRVLAGLSHTGYTTEIERDEARILIEELYQQVKKQKEVIDKAINFLEKWGEEPDADMYIQMKEYKEFNELLDILKEGKNE